MSTRTLAARSRILVALALPLGLTSFPAAGAEAELPIGLDHDRLAAIRTVLDVAMSPDGSRAAYTLNVPRKPGTEDDGAAHVELHLLSTDGGAGRPYVHGDVRVSQVRFTPDGKHVTYLAKRGEDEETALWSIPAAGGESAKLLQHDESLSAYSISPDGRQVAFVAVEKESKAREKLKKRGYGQEVFEEDWLHRRVWIAALKPAHAPLVDPAAAADEEDAEPRALAIEGSVFDVEWSHDGKRLALSVAPRPLIDDRYMKQRIQIFDAESGKRLVTLDNPGKLGDFRFSPDGRHVAMISAADPNDPSAGRLMLGPAGGGALVDLLPKLEGHVARFVWQDAQTLMFIADEGAETRLGEVDLSGKRQKTHLTSGNGRPVLTRLALSADGRHGAFVGSSPTHPAELFTMNHGQQQATRRTDSNPWLADVALARQEVARWTARDGLRLEGVLIHPLAPTDGAAPLLMLVHGGPESHVRNGWVTNYSRPGQLAAARGFAVFYPNYRGSTGRGVEFSKLGQHDAAGKEFDDLIDAIDHLVQAGIVDGDRVGVAGGSYGGYATAWCSTRFTDRFRAGVMFVGISNKISKGLTTEIPVEDKMVHTRFDPWTRWEFSLERSPIFHAEKSRTALLIAGGTADKRVHPSQSLQLYRALKLIGKTPVRYVRYPGEGHGNSKASARDDYSRRLVRWMEHFVAQKRTDLPPWELDLGTEEEPEDDDEEAGD